MSTNKEIKKGSRLRRCIFDGFLFAYLSVFLIVAILGTSERELVNAFREATTIFFLLFGLGTLIAWGVYRFRVRTLGEVIFPTSYTSGSEADKPLLKTFWGIQLVISVLVTIILGVFVAEVSILKILDKDAIGHAFRVFQSLANPDWSILPRAIIKIIETIFIAFMATFVAVPVAFCLSFVTARNIMGGTPLGFTVYAVLRTFFNLVRSVEPILWAIIFSIWVSFGPFAGMLALLVHSVASLAKQYSEIVEAVEDGPIEGIESTGANKIQTIWFAVVPQVILPYISFTIYRWDINVRMATILGFVGGGGIGTMLMEYQGQAMWHQVGCIIVVIAVVVWIMDTFSAHVREAIK